MNAAAHRTIVLQGPGTPAKPDGPEPDMPGPRPPPDELSARALMALVSQLTTGYSNVDGPEEPPGPVDPYIRKALERPVVGPGMASNLWRFIAEKHPEIWDFIGGNSLAGANRSPHPLPPRSAFLAAVVQEFAERMTTVCELADLIPRPGGEPGNLIVAGHVAKFVDEICRNGFKLRWPFPWPAPAWFSVSLNGADLIVMGTQFQQYAGLAVDRDLGRTFADAAHALLEAGAARIV